MSPRESFPRLQEILADWQDALGGDFAAYANHCCRVCIFCQALAGDGANREKIEVAAAFHDLGIWSDGTLDYLAPSQRLAMAYLEERKLAAWGPEIAAMIANHHKILPCRESPETLVENFRRADWVDVSLGLMKFGLPASFIRETQASFPDEGFHRRLLELGRDRFLAHPLSPLPMLKL